MNVSSIPVVKHVLSMRTANYIFSLISITLGIALMLFVLTQTSTWDLLTTIDVRRWSIGTGIGALLVLNGLIRLWFAQDDDDDED